MSKGKEPVVVPPDFPRTADLASLPGLQPKIAVILDAISDRYVANRDSAEAAARFEICEDLAVQLANKCNRCRDSKYAHLSEREILSQLQNKLLASGWGTSAEMTWTTRRTAEKLGWNWDTDALP